MRLRVSPHKEGVAHPPGPRVAPIKQWLERSLFAGRQMVPCIGIYERDYVQVGRVLDSGYEAAIYPLVLNRDESRDGLPKADPSFEYRAAGMGGGESQDERLFNITRRRQMTSLR